MNGIMNTMTASKFVKSVKDTAGGIHVSTELSELTKHIDGIYDGHAEAVENVEDFSGQIMKKIADNIEDTQGDVVEGVLEDAAEVALKAAGAGVTAVGDYLANSDVAGSAADVALNMVEVVHDTAREVSHAGAERVHGVTRYVLDKSEDISPKGLPDLEDTTEAANAIIDTARIAEDEIGSFLENAGEEIAEVVLPSAERLAGVVEDMAGPVAETLGTGEHLEAAVDAIPRIAEELAEGAGEAGNAVGGGIAGAVGGVVEWVFENAGEGMVQEAGEAVLDVVPAVGLVLGSCRFVWGAGTAVVGVGSLATCAAIWAGGGIVGAIAAPFDGGETLRNSMALAGATGAWGTSVAGKGLCTSTKGAAGIVSQVPGTQPVTIPLSIVSGYASNKCRQMRS